MALYIYINIKICIYPFSQPPSRWWFLTYFRIFTPKLGTNHRLYQTRLPGGVAVLCICITIGLEVGIGLITCPYLSYEYLICPPKNTFGLFTRFSPLFPLFPNVFCLVTHLKTHSFKTVVIGGCIKTSGISSNSSLQKLQQAIFERCRQVWGMSTAWDFDPSPVAHVTDVSCQQYFFPTDVRVP